MRLLVFVFAVSVLALLWAAWAIAKTIRRHGKPPPSSGTGLELQDRSSHVEPDEPEEH